MDNTLLGDEKLLSMAEQVKYDGNVVRGTHSTADAWNKELDLINFYHETYGSDGEEIESFAVAQVCKNFDVPCLSIRIISNSELYPDEIFDTTYAQYCQQFTLDFVEYYNANK